MCICVLRIMNCRTRTIHSHAIEVRKYCSQLAKTTCGEIVDLTADVSCFFISIMKTPVHKCCCGEIPHYLCEKLVEKPCGRWLTKFATTYQGKHTPEYTLLLWYVGSLFVVAEQMMVGNLRFAPLVVAPAFIAPRMLLLRLF